MVLSVLLSSILFDKRHILSKSDIRRFVTYEYVYLDANFVLENRFKKKLVETRFNPFWPLSFLG